MGRKITMRTALTLGMLMLTGCWGGISIGPRPTIIGSGRVVEQAREVAGFTSISVGSALVVDVSFDDVQAVTVSGDDNLVTLVQTEVKGATLEVFCNASRRTSNPLLVKVTVPYLDAIDVHGASRVTAHDLQGGSLSVKLSGASQLTVTGRVDEIDAQLSGASGLKAAELVSQYATVRASGASNAKLHTTESIVAKASGASNVVIRGSPPVVKQQSSGASNIKIE